TSPATGISATLLRPPQDLDHGLVLRTCEDAVSQPVRSGWGIGHAQSAGGGICIQLYCFFLQDARLLQIVGRRMIAFGSPIMLNLKFGAILGEAEFHEEGR